MAAGLKPKRNDAISLVEISEVVMVEAAGFEPATSGVRFQRSPSELRPHLFSASNFSATKLHLLEVKLEGASPDAPNSFFSCFWRAAPPSSRKKKKTAHQEMRPQNGSFFCSLDGHAPARPRSFGSQGCSPSRTKVFSAHWRARLLPSRDFGRWASRQVGNSANR